MPAIASNGVLQPVRPYVVSSMASAMSGKSVYVPRDLHLDGMPNPRHKVWKCLTSQERPQLVSSPLASPSEMARHLRDRAASPGIRPRMAQRDVIGKLPVSFNFIRDPDSKYGWASEPDSNLKKHWHKEVA